MADVMEDVSGQGSAGGAAAADSWLTVSSVTSEVCRDNAIGTLRCTCLEATPSCLQTADSLLQQDYVVNHVACEKCSILHWPGASACSPAE